MKQIRLFFHEIKCFLVKIRRLLAFTTMLLAFTMMLVIFATRHLAIAPTLGGRRSHAGRTMLPTWEYQLRRPSRSTPKPSYIIYFASQFSHKYLEISKEILIFSAEYQFITTIMETSKFSIGWFSSSFRCSYAGCSVLAEGQEVDSLGGCNNL